MPDLTSIIPYALPRIVVAAIAVLAGLYLRGVLP